jgi:hypothetical protein
MIATVFEELPISLLTVRLTLYVPGETNVCVEFCSELESPS